MRIEARGLVVLAALVLAISDDSAAHGANEAFAKTPEAPAPGVTPALPGKTVITIPVDNLGQVITTTEARPAGAGTWLQAYGRVIPDFKALVEVNVYVTGEIRDVYVRPGDVVRKGEPIVSIYSPEFVSTQRSYLALLQNKQQLDILREEGRLPDYLKDAKENLSWWGMHAEQIEALEKQGRIAQTIQLYAPAAGIVTEVLVQPGSLVNAGDKTMKAFVVTGRSVARMVADSRPYRIEGYVYADQQSLLMHNAPVRIELNGGRVIERKISAVLPDLDPTNQQARFLVELDQKIPGLLLGETVTLAVQVGRGDGVWVPRDAVLSPHLAPVVYVRKSAQEYERRPVTVLATANDDVQVSNLQPGEFAVTAGKMLLEGTYRMAAHRPGTGDGDHHH